MAENKRVKILLISTIVNRSIVRAIEDVKEHADVKLIFAHDLHKVDNLQSYVDWADIVLIDVRGDPLSLTELDYKDKDVVILVGGSSLFSLAKLGNFRMSRVKGANMSYGTNPESVKKWINRIQTIIEAMGKILPFGVFRDARSYIRIVKYWANGGYENYKNMFLFICKIKGLDVRAGNPIEYPEIGLYHPDYGYGYKPQIDPSKPTVGIIFYGGMHLESCIPTLREIMNRLDANIIPVYSDGIVNLKAMREYLKDDIDCIISLLWFRLNGGPLGGDPRPAIEFLEKKKAKLFTPAIMLMQEIEDWERSKRGLNVLQTITTVELPEMDGGVEPIPICGVRDCEVVPIPDRVDRFVNRVNKWLELKRKPNEEKRMAIIIYNYPPGEENLGSAAYIDTFASVERILERLEKEGYKVEKARIKDLFIERKLFNPKLYPPEKIECPRMSLEEYLRYFNELPEDVREEVIKFWGEPPGEIMVDEDGILIPGVILGNVFIGVQPSRPPLSCEDLYSAIHDQTKPPHHQYIAFYKWIENVFRADCVIHVGTHGLAEFMKGKEVGLSSKCFPDILIGTMPNLYVYHVINTSEATIAKRRLYGTLISYNSPPYTTSGLYEEYARLEELLNEYREASGKDEPRAEIAKKKALELAEKLNLGDNLDEIEAKLYEYKRSIIPKGLHVIGEEYSLEELEDFITLIARYDRGEIKSLNRLIAEKKGLAYEEVLNNPSKLKEIEEEAKEIVKRFLKGERFPEYEKTLKHALEVAKKFADNSLELENLIEGLNGLYIEPSVGGDVIRNPEVLPTGRNIYAFDPLKVPTESAVERGRKIAETTIRKYLEKHGKYPESVGVVLWGFETAKTYGETIAQILEYIGVRVVHASPWEKKLEVIPLEELGRPRIDVVVTICGFFREMFPNVMELLDKAFRMVAELDEPEEMNFVKKHVKELGNYGELAKARIFGPTSTEYNTRLLQLVEDGIWGEERDLAEAYISSMSYAYTKGHYSREAREVFESLLRKVDLVSQVRDSHDYEITDLDHYYEFFGGLSKSIELLKGEKPEMLIADTTREVVKVESVKEAIERGTITRILNPKWINEMLKHEFLGVQKIAERIENLLGLAATTNAVENWVWDKVAERFVFDEEIFERLKESNPYATKEILERLLEANKRGYWDADEEVLDELEDRYLELDGMLEEEI
ncbi:magnesium chelatase subunit H [Thermococcus sp. CX2]|uniref:magnesium chelatase subunit H n=1 Tax=Thermococcus sp. CX2 TaxID=163006 RepID=UPI00143968A1|nr:magnesium chelatase subunit H [Thermococcus sp. CX2]NJE85552.1 magnesium chelatase subunit H [Thermococcus sp. CX2]